MPNVFLGWQVLLGCSSSIAAHLTQRFRKFGEVRIRLFRPRTRPPFAR